MKNLTMLITLLTSVTLTHAMHNNDSQSASSFFGSVLATTRSLVSSAPTQPTMNEETDRMYQGIELIKKGIGYDEQKNCIENWAPCVLWGVAGGMTPCCPDLSKMIGYTGYLVGAYKLWQTHKKPKNE